MSHRDDDHIVDPETTQARNVRRDSKGRTGIDIECFLFIFTALCCSFCLCSIVVSLIDCLFSFWLHSGCTSICVFHLRRRSVFFIKKGFGFPVLQDHFCPANICRERRSFHVPLALAFDSVDSQSRQLLSGNRKGIEREKEHAMNNKMKAQKVTNGSSIHDLLKCCFSLHFDKSICMKGTTVHVLKKTAHFVVVLLRCSFHWSICVATQNCELTSRATTSVPIDITMTAEELWLLGLRYVKAFYVLYFLWKSRSKSLSETEHSTESV